MTIDEIIENEKNIVEKEQYFQDTHIMFTTDEGEDVTIEMFYADDTECINDALQNSALNLEYHKEIINLLEELKTYKEKVER